METVLFFSMLGAVISVAAPTLWMTSEEFQWQNLDGKMVTLSRQDGGSFSIYNPELFTTTTRSPTTTRSLISTTRSPTTTRSLISTTRSSTTTRSPTTTRSLISTTRSSTTTRSPTTTAPVSSPTPTPTPAGVSVCLRYAIDTTEISFNPTIFTLNPSGSGWLQLRVSYTDRYQVGINGYTSTSMSLMTDKVLWPTIEQSLWTRICLTVDSQKKLVQMFNGGKISIQKILRYSYIPSDRPVIQFSGFSGQVTDVQMWDYPLSYQEVFAFMNFPIFRPAGSVLSWSHTGYSLRGSVLVGDTYEVQAKKPLRGKRGKKRMFSSLLQAKRTSKQFF